MWRAVGSFHRRDDSCKCCRIEASSSDVQAVEESFTGGGTGGLATTGRFIRPTGEEESGTGEVVEDETGDGVEGGATGEE